MTRIQTLDGWRGIAILLVIVNHAVSYGSHVGAFWAGLGGSGVDIFFVLSGYIITMRLLVEHAKSSRIDLRSFYIRRAFRILPLVVLYLLTLCLISLAVDLLDFHKSEVLTSLLFLRNYQVWLRPGGVYTAHLWSLAIEEHFYLMWPGILVWLGRKWAGWAAIAGAIACAAWRRYDYLTGITRHLSFIHPSGTTFPIRTDVRLDGLLLGAALAILLAHPRVRENVFERLPRNLALPLAALALLSVRYSHLLPSFSTNILIAAMLAATVFSQRGAVHNLLNSRVLVWIGQISYSLYIWQQLFLLRPFPEAVPLGRVNLLPLSLVCAFAAASCSYYFFEKPLVTFGRQLRSTGRSR